MSENAVVLAQESEGGIRMPETLINRLTYCRKMLWIHGMMADFENREVTHRIGKLEERQKAPQEPPK